MRRTFWTALLGGVVVLAPVALAAPSPQLSDPKGDWQVSSQDVLSGRISSVLAAGRPNLVGELSLAAAPAAGVVSQYALNFLVGCDAYTFSYFWPGTTQGAKATLDHYSFCQERPVTEPLPDDSTSTTFAVKGTTLTWQLPYTGKIVKGARANGFSAVGCSAIGAVFFGDSITGLHEVDTGDVAYATNRSYVIGSDLPRR
jgi:hypothetical protein